MSHNSTERRRAKKTLLENSSSVTILIIPAVASIWNWLNPQEEIVSNVWNMILYSFPELRVILNFHRSKRFKHPHRFLSTTFVTSAKTSRRHADQERQGFLPKHRDVTKWWLMWGQQSHKSKEAWKYESMKQGHQSKGVKKTSKTPENRTLKPKAFYSFTGGRRHDEFGGTQNDLTEPWKVEKWWSKIQGRFAGRKFLQEYPWVSKIWFHSPTSYVCVFSPSIRDVYGNKKKSLLMVKHLKFPQNLLISRNLLGFFLSNVDLQSPNG